MKFLSTLALLLLSGLFCYIRLAPSDPARWHTDPATGQSGPGSHALRQSYALPPAELLARLDAVALATPRTTRLAGSPESGRMTWITRSRFWGFPDYTTAAATPNGAGGSDLALFARLRFGRSDFGVNAARLALWRARL